MIVGTMSVATSAGVGIFAAALGSFWNYPVGQFGWDNLWFSDKRLLDISVVTERFGPDNLRGNWAAMNFCSSIGLLAAFFLFLG